MDHECALFVCSILLGLSAVILRGLRSAEHVDVCQFVIFGTFVAIFIVMFSARGKELEYPLFTMIVGVAAGYLLGEAMLIAFKYFRN